MGKQDPNAGRNWYVVHTYAGYEDAVRQAILQRVESFGMQDYILDVRVPKEKQLTFKKGEAVEEERKLFPGYVLVDMIVTDESWYLVRNTPNVTGFVGSGNIPVPVTPEEFGVIERRVGEQEAKYKSDFQIGDLVRVRLTSVEIPRRRINFSVEEKLARATDILAAPRAGGRAAVKMEQRYIKGLKEIKEFRKELQECKRPLIFFDDDADGLCSFLLLYLTLYLF